MTACRGKLASFVMAAVIVATPALAGKADDTLNIAFSEEITTLDQYKELAREGLILGRLVYDGLVNKDLKTGEFRPELAESYKYIDDKTIDFKLRQGVKFHNGQTMTADDVVYTLNLVASKQYNARFQISVEWIDKAEKIGAYDVRLHMKTPNPFALEFLSGNVPIYPKAYYESVGPEGMGTKPVGTGPYRLVELTPGTRYVFERFEDYFAASPKGRPAIKRLIVRVLPEANTQYVELLNGRVDWIWRVPQDQARNLSRQANVEIKPAEIMRFAHIMINLNYADGKSPLADVRVRRALNHAIDREGIAKALIGGASRVIHSACNPLQFGCPTDVAKYDYNPNKAKALLAEAGYPNGIKTELMIAGIPGDQIAAMIANLKTAGIEVIPNPQQYAAAMTAWREGRAPLLVISTGSFGVADVGLGAGQFFRGDDLVKDPEVVALFQQANSSVDRKLREANYVKALKRVADQAYWIPLWTYSVNCAQNKDLEFTLDPNEFPQFSRARWK
jgi:peptide/nickel transport system substrate-binding protein